MKCPFGLLPSAGYCEQCYYEHRCENVSEILLSIILHIHPEMGLLDHMVVIFLSCNTFHLSLRPCLSFSLDRGRKFQRGPGRASSEKAWASLPGYFSPMGCLSLTAQLNHMSLPRAAVHHTLTPTTRSMCVGSKSDPVSISIQNLRVWPYLEIGSLQV